jgi:hypothetical protein
VVVGTDIEPANIISPDDQYIWFSSHAVPPLIRNFFFEFENINNRAHLIPCSQRAKDFSSETILR